MNYFATEKQVYAAAAYWYNKWDINSCCLAENRLAKGEVPYEGFYDETSVRKGEGKDTTEVSL